MKMKKRIDKFILEKYPNLSRAFIKQQIKLGNILIYPVRSLKIEPEIPQSEPQAKSPQKLKIRTKYAWTSNGVDGKKVKPSYVLRQGDLVALAPGFTLPTETKIQPNPNMKLNIVYENSDVIVLDKPAGLIVHPRQTKTGVPIAKELNNTLVSGLLAHYPLLTNVGDNPTIRPGIVHRLDKDTSGLMIVAKNQKSFNWLKKQFQERKVQKKYLALVCGQPKNDSDTIEAPLGRSKSDPTKQKIDSQGKPAVTDYKTIKRFKNFTLIEARPKTGRLHQIRVHLAHLGHPVAGDKKYGQENRPCPAGLKRQFLHAQELKIILPEGNKKTFSAPLPMDLTTIIEKLEKK